MKYHIHSSPNTTACALIVRILELLKQNPDRKFNIAFSGGGTPAIMFDIWANDYADVTPWERINFWWVDERCVDPEDGESNYGLMFKLLLSVVPVHRSNVFRIRGEEDPETEAIRYSNLVMKHVPSKDKRPIFDLVLLGIGADGHTSSIFSGQEHLLSSAHIYEVSLNPRNKQKRIALTGYPIINADHIIFLVTGREKAAIISEINSSGDTTPSAYIIHRAKKVELFVDKAAAEFISPKS